MNLSVSVTSDNGHNSDTAFLTSTQTTDSSGFVLLNTGSDSLGDSGSSSLITGEVTRGNTSAFMLASGVGGSGAGDKDAVRAEGEQH